MQRRNNNSRVETIKETPTQPQDQTQQQSTSVQPKTKSTTNLNNIQRTNKQWDKHRRKQKIN